MNNGQSVEPAGGTRFIIDADDIPFGAYQAIYHKITKRVEKFRKSYAGIFEIGLDDVKELHVRLSQSLSQYNVVGKDVEVSHFINEAQSFSYSSFEKFQIADKSSPGYTKLLTYTLSALIILPGEIPEAENIAQRYRIIVEFDPPSPKAEESNLPMIFQFFTDDHSISLTIEHPDYAVALALRSIVDGWADGLKKKKDSKVLKFLNGPGSPEKMKLSTAIAAFPFLAALLWSLASDEMGVRELSVVGFSAAVISIISIFTVSSLHSKLSNISGRLRPKTRVYITRGDHSIHENSELRNGRIIQFAAYAISLIIAISINISSAYIFELMLKM